MKPHKHKKAPTRRLFVYKLEDLFVQQFIKRQ
jgi:hypothetical protein